MPEPMKSELLAANDVVEMKRLGGGKVTWAQVCVLVLLSIVISNMGKVAWAQNSRNWGNGKGYIG